jgi:hypothetical protein
VVTGSDNRLLMLSGLMLGSGQIYLESICCVWVSAAVELKTAINVRMSQSCGGCSRIWKQVRS